jgi:hypothetical protein
VGQSLQGLGKKGFPGSQSSESVAPENDVDKASGPHERPKRAPLQLLLKKGIKRSIMIMSTELVTM